ncbi:MltA domain-containing protein [Colwellia sp. E2M01]|uniref:MltA domain-containing protein n=1 Tax=Colwellia sp. E2M01 TaxID=2841561 RepID=UPI001C08D531|nr:MltA domain-containing protein [Colwellia sp. E2M01]MBU2871688.1 MltA domain-containing protein [Colwellia sp. E2M01]
MRYFSFCFLSVVLLLLFTSILTATKSLAQPQFTLVKQTDFNSLRQLNLNAIDYASLCEVAYNTQQYIEQHSDDDFAVHAGETLLPFSNKARVTATLAFICDIYHQDKANNTNRLADINFLTKHFDFYRWLPDQAKAEAIAQKSTNKRKAEMLRAIPKEQLFLTKYYTKLLTGSPVKTETYSQALYQLPGDEKDLTLAEAELKKASLTRYQFTRQQVISGVLTAKNLAKPLVWITEEALHDVLLQGTGVLKVNGEIRYFNVHRNNGIAYDYALGKREQARYWYFAEVPSIMGYGKDLASKIAIKPQVSFAGNVKQLGLGQLILVAGNSPKTDFVRLGVLADQGGAFDDNLFQLDLLVDSYQGWTDYHQANKNLPDYNNAWLLLKKQ